LSDVYPAIRFLLKSLGDHHSFFLEPIASHQELTGGVASSPSSVAMKPGGIGYIDMPGYRGMEASAIHAFANDMVNSIGHIATQARCGWVVDLRNDTGGNMMPMLEGLRPLLGDRPLGSFRNADGHLSPFSAINRLDKMQFKGPALEHATVAVLLGQRTGSSGEVVAVSFVGRPLTGSFGQPTAGLSSANTGFPLPDHSMIFLTTAIDMDRTGHSYGNKMQPDQIIAAPTTSTTDPTLDAAQAWLASSCTH
jgi:C-terminal processing protease CtpA/Prc